MNTRKFMEAVESAAPVIVFLDEIDSILSSGRSSGGDSARKSPPPRPIPKMVWGYSCWMPTGCGRAPRCNSS